MPYAKPEFLEASLPRGTIFEKLLSSHCKKKLYLEVSPGSKLFDIYSFITKQIHLANADEKQQQKLIMPHFSTNHCDMWHIILKSFLL